MADPKKPLIFVSSPGDVSEERALAESVLRRLGEEYRGSVQLDVVLWEHEPVFAHTGYQQQIVRPSECDLVICILWSRLGTRLPAGFALGSGGSAPTGTEFEVRDALEGYRVVGKPNLLIYRKTVAPQLNMASPEARERLRQYELLDEFCRRTFYDEQGAIIVAHTSYGESYEFERKLSDHVRRWLALQVGEAATRARWTSGSPYRGLQAFEAEHREIYFGRSQALSELVGRLRDTETRAASGERVTRFLMVQGMSGNGKSSLIRAGLLPLLEGRALEGIGLWRQVILKPSDRSEQRPGEGVVGALLTALGKTIPAIGDSYPDTAQLADRVRSAPNESAARLDGYLTQEAIRIGLRPDQMRLVVFIDQLEELFEQSLEQSERLAFIAILDALAREGRIWVIATVRSDFAARIEDHAALVKLTREGHLYILGPPQSDELAEMIREPAQAAGLQWEIRAGVSLDQAILRDATANPESLPLLEYALDQLYERHSGQRLTYADYEGLGGLKGGIAQSAEAVLADQQGVASSFPKLMRSLVSVDESGTATRRYAPLSEFAAGTPERALLEALIARRLCVADRRGEEAVASFAHEALIQSWPRVAEWLQTEAGLLQIRELALRDTRLWQQHGESEAWLATADKLVAFKALESAHVALPEQGWRFIERSRRRVQRVTRIKQLAVCIIALLAIAALGAGWIASKKQHEAEHQTAQTLKAQSRLLTEAASERLKEDDIATARSIILEVLSNATSLNRPDATAVNVFQEMRASDPLAAVLSGHDGAVRRVAYSPDGARIVTASLDHTARIWDARTGTELRVLSGFPRVVMSAVFSPDGLRILTASGDVRIWDLQSGNLLQVLGDPKQGVSSASFSPDGARVLTAGADARVWDVQTGRPLLVFAGNENEGLIDAAFSPDGARIVTASTDRTARIWNASTGAQLMVLSGHGDAVSGVAFSPDGTRVVTASHDSTARIWDAQTGKVLNVLPGIVGQVWGVAYSPDGARIVTASVDRAARIWDARTGTLLRTLTGHTDILSSAAFSPDGSHVVTGGYDRTARIWDLRGGPDTLVLAGHGDRLNSAAYSPDGTRVVTASDDKTARIWDARTGVQLAVLAGHHDAVSSAVYSPDGTQILTASDVARIWDARTNLAVLTFGEHLGGVLDASYSPDGTHLVASLDDGTARIWDARTGVQEAVMSGYREEISTVRYSPDGRRILTASIDKTVRIWDARTGSQLELLPHPDFVNSAVYSPDGTQIVTASKDTYARLWDVRRGEQVALLAGNREFVNHAEFSPDGAHIATAGRDRTIRIWDTRTGTELAVLRGHSARLVSVAYSPDGSRIVSASADKTARIWDARLPGDLPTQLTWEQAAESDPLPDVERTQLGMLSTTLVDHRWTGAGKCDLQAAAFYDPERQAPGIEQTRINADLANTACSGEAAAPGATARLTYQAGRALRAKGDFLGASRAYQRALAGGYRAARIDLADVMLDTANPQADPDRAASLYVQAWDSGVAIGAFKRGQLYDNGWRRVGGSADRVVAADPAAAWDWYQKGAAVHEPESLGRLGQRTETLAETEPDRAKRNALLLQAFSYYAAAAQRARAEDWPDEAWRHWRYRRATLARVLADEGLMQQVADAYAVVRDKSAKQK